MDSFLGARAAASLSGCALRRCRIVGFARKSRCMDGYSVQKISKSYVFFVAVMQQPTWELAERPDFICSLGFTGKDTFVITAVATVVLCPSSKICQENPDFANFLHANTAKTGFISARNGVL